MSTVVRHQLWVLLAAAVVILTNLGGPALWDEDEPKNAQCGREMLERGDLIVPSFNQDLRTDKPVMLYWLMMTSYAALGVSELTARLPSALLGLGTCLMVYHLGRLLFRPQVGLWAGIILASSLMFDAVARAATPDSTLIFFSTLAMLAFVVSVSPRDGGYLPRHWLGYVATYGAMGLAVLTKGPVGVVLPTLVLVCYVRTQLGITATQASGGWLTRAMAWLDPRMWILAGWKLRPFTALAVVGLIALPWYIAVGVNTNGEWLAGFLGKHNVGRFMEPMENHRGPIVYYIPAILAGLFPWSVMLLGSILDLSGQLRRGTDERSSYAFIGCWAGLWIGFFSLAATKLPNYVLPSYPALALITSVYICRWMENPAVIRRGWTRAAFGSMVVAGLGLTVGLAITAHLLLDKNWVVAAIGIIPLVGGLVAWRFSEQGRSRQSAVALAASALLLAVGVHAVAAQLISPHQNSPSLVATIQRTAGQPANIATYGFSAPTLTFYSNQRVEILATADQAQALFADDEPSFLITTSEALEQVRYHLPADVQIIDRQRRFLRQYDLVLLGRGADSTATAPSPQRR